MTAKKPQRRLPFEAAYGKSKSGRPRAPRIVLTCSRCGSDVERYASQVAKKQTKRVFCTACFLFARTRGLKPRRYGTSIVELKRMHNGQPVRMDSHGYPYIFEPTFSADRQWSGLPKGWHFEHRVVMSRTLGRPFQRDEHVHHINGDKTDNRPENLRVLSRQAHKTLHNDEIAHKLRRLAEYERRYGPLNDLPPADVVRALADGIARAVGAPIDHWLIDQLLEGKEKQPVH